MFDAIIFWSIFAQSNFRHSMSRAKFHLFDILHG